jgi:hypothetical protein
MINEVKTTTEIVSERIIQDEQNVRPVNIQSSKTAHNNRKRTKGRNIQVIEFYDWNKKKMVQKQIVHLK